MVVGGIGIAGSGTFTGVVDTGEVLDAHVCILANRVERGIDGTAEFRGSGETGLGIRGIVLGVAVRASDHDLELVTVLAGVDGGLGGDTGTPESALDVGEACGVVTARSWVNGGVALEVDVEGCAEIGGIAKLLAFNGVVGLEGCQTHVAVRVDGCLEVLEGYLIALRGLGVVGGVLCDI